MTPPHPHALAPSPHCAPTSLHLPQKLPFLDPWLRLVAPHRTAPHRTHRCCFAAAWRSAFPPCALLPLPPERADCTSSLPERCLARADRPAWRPALCACVRRARNMSGSIQAASKWNDTGAHATYEYTPEIALLETHILYMRVHAAIGWELWGCHARWSALG
eukprot:210107-Chlamydomonas_euryale.AAC.1